LRKTTAIPSCAAGPNARQGFFQRVLIIQNGVCCLTDVKISAVIGFRETLSDIFKPRQTNTCTNGFSSFHHHHRDEIWLSEFRFIE
jgi:hypothetical protein